MKPSRLPIDDDPVIPATMNTLKHDPERKKKSVEGFFIGSRASSPSSDEESSASDEEKEGARQKGSEESDGRRPMAEEERKVTDGNSGELLLPWKAEVCDPFVLLR